MKQLEEINQLKNEFDAEMEALKENYSERLTKLVRKNMNQHVYMCSGMGSTFMCSLKDRDKDYDNEYLDVLQELTWGVKYGLEIPYKMSKKGVVKREDHVMIENLYREEGYDLSIYNEREVKDFGLIPIYDAHIKVLNGAKINRKLIRNEKA